MRSHRLFLRLTYFTGRKALKVRGVTAKGRMSCFGGKCPAGLRYLPSMLPSVDARLVSVAIGKSAAANVGAQKGPGGSDFISFPCPEVGLVGHRVREGTSPSTQLPHHAPHPTAAQASGADVTSGLPWVTRWRRGAWDAQDCARVTPNSGDFNGEL